MLVDVMAKDQQRRAIVLRLISAGQWNVAASGQIGKNGADGYTVWRWASGKLHGVKCEDGRTAVEAALTV